MNVYCYEQRAADVPAEQAWLSCSEVDHVRSLRFPKRRADWLLGRWTAKNAVAILPGSTANLSSLADIEIRPAISGAPEVFFRDESAPISISLSHRDGVAFCALAPPGVLLGCDLEAVEPHSDAFARDYFSAEEQALVQDTPISDRDRILTLLWSAKESALKALGEGLRLDTRQVIARFRGALARENENTGNASRSSSVCMQDNVWYPLEVRKTSGPILQGWWSQTSRLLRTVLAVPAPSPPVLMTKQGDRRMSTTGLRNICQC